MASALRPLRSLVLTKPAVTLWRHSSGPWRVPLMKSQGLLSTAKWWLLTSTAKSTTTCQWWEWVTLEANPPALVKPSDYCSSSWQLNYNHLENLRQNQPAKVLPNSYHKNCETVNIFNYFNTSNLGIICYAAKDN